MFCNKSLTLNGMNKPRRRNNEDEEASGPSQEELYVMDELFDEFAKKAGLVRDRRNRSLCKHSLQLAAEFCLENKISPRFYVRAVMSYQPPEGKNGGYMPWQLWPASAAQFVENYLLTCGTRDIKREFESQCTMLGNAMRNGVPDRIHLLNPSTDFQPWFRVLMTAEPEPLIIEKYGAEAGKRLELDYELKSFLTNLDIGGAKLDLKRIPNLKYE